jgi:hypothetical protein
MSTATTSRDLGTAGTFNAPRTKTLLIASLHRSPVTLLSLVLFGCAGDVKPPTKPSHFEIDFYASLERIDPKDSLTAFDLSDLTSFAWDSVFVIEGDESEPIDSPYISERLHRSAEELPVSSDRFYFVKSGRVVSVFQIDKVSLGWRDMVWDIYPCTYDPTINCTCQPTWLSREECHFFIKKTEHPDWVHVALKPSCTANQNTPASTADSSSGVNPLP